MTTDELLRTRSERGTARGATAVWAEATRDRPASTDARDAARRPSRGRYQLTIGIAAALLVGAMAVARFVVDDPPIDPAPTNSSTDRDRPDEPDAAEDPSLPDPILIEGMTLEMIIEPINRRLRGGDRSIAQRAIIGEEVPVPPNEETGTVSVFAEPDRPLEGRIVVIETLDGGGFRAGGANLDQAELVSLTSSATRDENEASWQLGPETGLVRVAELDGGATTGLDVGWQFDFARGDETATVQAEPAVGNGPWRWIARLVLGSDGLNVSVEPIEVLGETGVVLSAIDEDIVWSRGDNVYRLTAGLVRGDTHESVSASAYVSRLRLVDRDDWLAAVDDANSRSLDDTLGEAFQVLGFAALAVGGVLLIAAQRRWLVGGLALLAAGTFLFFAAGPSSAPLMGVLLFVVGLAWLATNNAATRRIARADGQ